MVAAPSPSFGWPQPRRSRRMLAVVGVVALVAALAWAFISAGGLQPAAHDESSCEQLWQEGRHTSTLAGADHDAFIAACLAR